jgi:hypothetical protein
MCEYKSVLVFSSVVKEDEKPLKEDSFNGIIGFIYLMAESVSKIGIITDGGTLAYLEG